MCKETTRNAFKCQNLKCEQVIYRYGTILKQDVFVKQDAPRCNKVETWQKSLSPKF